ncbi:MAG: glycosyltransferase, partial [Candidatus Omnitrophica bacterium]|nr:glycosyltransferase [Candidatus Omnitrophota bacterium]
MKDKKSLLITFDFPPQVTGIGTYLSGIWKDLYKNDNYILAPAVKSAKGFDITSGLNIFRYPGFTRFKILRTIVLFCLTFNFLIKNKINLVFCSVPLSLGCIGLIFKLIFKLPYGVFYYGGEYSKFKENRILWPVLNKIMKNADFVITISEFSRAEAGKFGLKQDLVYIVTPGVDINKFKPDDDTGKINNYLKLENKQILLTVARLVKRKGVHLVIEALKKLKKDFPELVYLVVGSGEEEDNLKKQAKESGLENDVCFLGSVPDEDLPV